MVQAGDLHTMWGHVKKLKLHMHPFEETLTELTKRVHYFPVLNSLRSINITRAVFVKCHLVFV